MQRPLTPNHQRIFDALRTAGRPVTAYEVIDAVRPFGISAPPTVYRALNRLIADGLAHRLESLNAYVACTHDHDPRGAVLFTICTGCGESREIDDPDLNDRVMGQAARQRFVVRAATLELRGICAACAEAAADEEPDGGS